MIFDNLSPERLRRLGQDADRIVGASIHLRAECLRSVTGIR
jgi:hypothetical protein